MIVVDASCLAEVVVGGPMASAVRERLVHEPDQAAPHVLDVEVLGVIRRLERAGEIDGAAAALALDDLRDWPGERVGHRALLPRAWELRHGVRGRERDVRGPLRASGRPAADARRPHDPGRRAGVPDRRRRLTRRPRRLR